MWLHGCVSSEPTFLHRLIGTLKKLNWMRQRKILENPAKNWTKKPPQQLRTLLFYQLTVKWIVLLGDLGSLINIPNIPALQNNAKNPQNPQTNKKSSSKTQVREIVNKPTRQMKEKNPTSWMILILSMIQSEVFQNLLQPISPINHPVSR